MQTISTPDGQVYQFPDTMSREQIAAAIQARLAKKANPEGTGVGRGLQRGYYQTRAFPSTLAANAYVAAMTDKARLESPEGDSGMAYEELRTVGVPQGAFASRAANTGNPQQNVAMMQQYGVSPLLQTNFSQVLDKRIQNAQNIDVADASPRLAEHLSFAGKMHDKAAALPKSPVAAKYEQALAEAPDSFKGWLGTITNDPVGFMSWAGETLAESGPAIGAGGATTLLTGNPVLGSSVMAMGGLSREYSNEVSRFLQEKGIDLSDEDALKALLNNPKAMQEANQRGVTRGLVIALFEMAGQGAVASNIFGKTILRRTGSQMVTEGGGEAAATYAVGDEVSIKDTLAEASVGAGSAVPESIVAGKNKLFTSKGTLADPTTLEESYRGAAGDVARQLQELAKANGYNLKDIDNSSEKGAKQALEDLRQGNNETITGLVAVLKPLLSPKNAKSLEDLLLNYTQASAGIKGAKKKVSSRVTQDQLDAARRLVGGLKEGQELLNALQKSNVITDLFKRGVQGGVSRFTDLFNPISMAGAGYNAPKIAANAMLGSGLPMITQGGTIPVQGALWVMGRLTDAMTGRRSKVARFVRQNTGKFGLPTPEGPSIIAAEKLKEQKAEASKNQAKAIRASLAQFNTKMNVADFEQSPIGNFLFRTGLDKQGLIDVVSMMAKDPDIANDPGMLALIDQINENLAGGENQIEALSDAILAVGAYAQQNAPHLIKFQPDSPSLLRSFDPSASPEVSSGAAPQQATQDPQQSGRQFTSPENYQAGIDANVELADTLQSTLSADPDVSVTDKGQLLSVLEGLKQPLTNPTVQLQTDIEALQRNDVSSEAIDKYVRPYLDRVTNQREQKSRLQRLQDAPKKPNTQTEAPAPTEAMTKAPVTPQTAGGRIAEGSIIEGAVRAISEGTMAPESVDAMLSSLEASTPGIRAKIEAIVNRQPPEAPAAPALAETPAIDNAAASPSSLSTIPTQVLVGDTIGDGLTVADSSGQAIGDRVGHRAPENLELRRSGPGQFTNMKNEPIGGIDNAPYGEPVRRVIYNSDGTTTIQVGSRISGKGSGYARDNYVSAAVTLPSSATQAQKEAAYREAVANWRSNYQGATTSGDIKRNAAKTVANEDVSTLSPEAPAAPALRQQDDRDLEVDQSSPSLLSTSEAGRKVKDQVIEGSLLYGKLSGNKDHIAFESVSNLSSDLADAVKESIDELNIRNIEVRTDISNVSPSSYVQVQILDEASWDPEYEEYLDIEDEFKLRFSDHPDYQQSSASDKTIRFDQSKTLEHLEDIEGYYGSKIDFLEFKSLVQEGVDTVLSKVDAETTTAPALRQQDSRDLEEGFEGYLNKVNPDNKRIAEEDRPNLMMGDMYGMLPRGSEVINEREDGVTFHRSPNGDYFATAYNPDVGEQDVVGYIMGRGNSTELQVVAEMQNQGIGSELQYMFRSENPNAPTGGLTEAGEGALSRTYDRMFAEGIVDDRDLEVDQSSPARPALQDVVPVGTNTNVPMETAITRASNTSKATVYRKGRDLKVDLQKQSLKAQRLNKINLQEMTPENVGRLGDFALFDALEALKTNQNAIGWYEATIDKMVQNLSHLYPEIKTKQANRLQFFWALAATSNGLKVDKNLDLAVQVYEHLQRTGRFPTDAGIGEQANGINSGLAAYHTMLDKFNGDHKKLEEFALKKQTVRDIQNQYGVNISGEGVDTVVRGASVIGPKIGNGFFSNLYGEYDALTMDRWLMRSVGRWRGNLIKRNKPMERKKRDELWDFLRALDDDQLGRLKTLYKGTKTKISNKAMTDTALDKLAETTAKLSMKPKWRALINEEFKNVRLIGNGLAGYLDGQIEAPSGPVERAFIREVFEKALVDLNNNPEVRKVSNKPLTMADFQALLWYQEKLLYDTAKKPVGEESKGYKDDEAPDYANAAQKLVDNRRGNTGRNRLGLARSASGRGRGTSASNDGQRGQPLSKGALSREDEDAPILTGATERAGSSDNIRDDGQGQKERPETLGALALQGATGNPQVVTSLEGLSDPETAADFYTRPGWAIITATNENLPDSIRDTRNKENNAYLEQQLQEKGIASIPVSGAYKGIDQGSSFLILAGEPTAMQLGKQHLQESILTNEGLLYTSRPGATTPTTGQNLFGPEAQKEDFYSTASSLPFSLGLDFSIGPGQQHYKVGYVEAPNRPQLPMRESDGMVELHHWSSKQLKTVDPHYSGSGPLLGAERKRGAKLSFFGIAPRNELRAPGTGYVKEAGLGPVEHVALVDPNDLYPVFEDPDGILNDVGANWSKAEDIIRDAGYKGYYVTDDGQGKAPLGNVATLFDPIEVSEVKQSDDREAPALSDFIRNGSSQLRRALSRRVPSKQEVVDQFPAVKALFEIGKKGSPYENGITNIEDALTLAKALGITVHMFNDHQKMLETLESDSKTLRGRFTKTSNGASGTVFALEPGTDFRGRNLTEIEALTTLVHEIFHGVTMAPMSGVGPMLNGNGNGTPSVENAIGAMIDKPQGKRTPQERKILREITRLQNSLSAYVEGKPTERRPVRGLIAAMENFDQRRNQMTPEEQMDLENKIDAHVKYIRSKGEFSVDPFWVYAVNPKMAKLVMPETAKWIQGELRKAGNKDIQFFTHPLAISIAVVMALMASEQAEDEQEEQQPMQPGALSPNAGMLSAA